MLAVCFATGNASIFWNPCNMEFAPPQEQAMADMPDCHMDMQNAPDKPAPKKCCIDFSCPKCFSSPLADTRPVTPELYTVPTARSQDVRVHLASFSPTTPDRPPKA